jgi:hypothetical protein
MEVSAKCFLTVSFPIMVTNHGQEIPAHLSACDFFLWDYLKGKVNTSHPNNITVLKQRIEKEIQNIPDMLSKAMADVRERVEGCLRKGGSHLTNTVFKK